MPSEVFQAGALLGTGGGGFVEGGSRVAEKKSSNSLWGNRGSSEVRYCGAVEYEKRVRGGTITKTGPATLVAKDQSLPKGGALKD